MESSQTDPQIRDVEINQPPTDAVSELAFNPKANFLAASSWDNEVRVWEVMDTGASAGKAAYSHEAPALCCAWSRDGSKLASGGADKAGRMLDISTGQTTQIAQHDGPIRCIRFVEAENSTPIAATASWDKTLKYWDLRQQSPIGTVNLPERAYAMDCKHPLLVVATAERKMLIFNLSNPTTPFETSDSPLKWQTRTVSCFTSGDGYTVGSIEGRVGIQYVDPSLKEKSFSFKCHRDASRAIEAQVYTINSITHHPIYGTFVTGSNDGSFVSWDKDSRHKLKTYSKLGSPVLSTAFNGDGKLFAYALGYDWSQGYKGNVGTIKNTIKLHAVLDDDVKPKQR